MVEQRRATRFELRLPLRIMRSGTGYTSQEDALTRNISSSGVLFASPSDAPVGGAIEYVVTLSAENGRYVDLRCFGKVVRLEKFTSEPQRHVYLIAATLDRYQFVRRQR